MLICVDPQKVHAVWPKVSHWIKRAMERGDLGRFDDTEQDVMSGNALLWIVWNDPNITGAGVTKLDRTECTKACVIVAYGGDGFSQELLNTIEDYARAEGCDAVRIYGRRGWARALPDYRTARIVLQKDLI